MALEGTNAFAVANREERSLASFGSMVAKEYPYQPQQDIFAYTRLLEALSPRHNIATSNPYFVKSFHQNVEHDD